MPLTCNGNARLLYYVGPLVYSDDAIARRSLYRAYCCPMYVEEVMAHGCAVCVCNEERRTMEERAFVGRRPDERARRSVVLSASLRKRVNFAHPHTPPDSLRFSAPCRNRSRAGRATKTAFRAVVRSSLVMYPRKRETRGARVLLVAIIRFFGFSVAMLPYGRTCSEGRRPEEGEEGCR